MTAVYHATVRRLVRDRAPAILRLHGTGLSAAEIARRLDFHPETVRVFLRSLGLRPHGQTSAFWVRENAKRRRRSGWKMEKVRAELWRCAAAHRGWPLADTPRQCDVLDLLESRGSLSQTEIAEALGLVVDYDVSRKRRWSRTACYHLRRLETLGLVSVVGKRRGRTNAVRLFGLAAGVARHRAARLQSEGSAKHWDRSERVARIGRVAT